MKRLTLVALAFGACAALAGCEDPRPAQEETMTVEPEAPVAPIAEEPTAPVADPNATTAPSTDHNTLPPEDRASAETVQPESETLFY